jgi:rod shape determining protein RodA
MKKSKFNIPDPKLTMNVAGLIAIGLLALSSAAGGLFFFKQLIFILVSLIIIYFIYKIIDISFYENFSFLIYSFNIILLVLLKFMGSTVLGAQRWLKLGPISIQPSEIAKICLIVFLASWLSKNPIRSFWDIFKTTVLVTPPALLVLIQPDLGTTLVYGAICVGMLFWAGAKLIELLIILSPVFTAILSSIGTILFHYEKGFINFNLTIPVLIYFVALTLATVIYYKAWRSPILATLIFTLISTNIVVMIFRTIAWALLKEYQQKRLTIFLDPYVDPLGAGYHIIQSLYAIGSGGIFGFGLKEGDMTQGQFVPEQHTDFIFSAIGEEFGFIGCLITITLFIFLCIQLINRAKHTNDKFASLICIGTLSMLLFHIFVNIGMNLSIMPITGVPLPFISYGGSAMLVNIFLISLIIKTSSEKKFLRAN